MSLRKIAKILGISPTYLSLLLNGKRPWRGNLKERYEELVNTNDTLPEAPSCSSIQGVYQLPTTESWREREGVEPTAPTEGPGPTDLKSAKPTGTHPLPQSSTTPLSLPQLFELFSTTEMLSGKIGFRKLLRYSLIYSSLEGCFWHSANYLVNR